MSKTEREEKLLQGIQSENGLKTLNSAKKEDSMAVTVTINENAIKKTFGKRFTTPLDFEFFKHPKIFMGLKKILL